MTDSSTSRVLPARPDLDQLKKQAKDLQRERGLATRAQAQFVLGREYGVANWAALKRRVQHLTLHRLIEENDVESARVLLTSAPSLATLPFDDGTTPLHVAAGENRPDMVDLLMARGATVPTRLAGSGHSALSWALTCWAFDAAERLVERGTVPDLFCAAGLGDVARVQAFWPEGRLVPKPSTTGSSRYDASGHRLPCPPARAADQVSDALYLACRCDRLDVARWLLDHGADPNWRGYCGGTCLAWAEFSGNAALTALLRARGGDDALTDHTFGAHPRAFAVMVLAGWGFGKKLATRLYVDRTLAAERCARGTTLHVAAAGGQEAAVRILLHFGADRAALDPQGRTARDLAAAAGHAAVVTLLT